MKLKMMTFCTLIAIGSPVAHAISIGSISDSISGSLKSSASQPTYTAAIPKNKTNTKTDPVTTQKDTTEIKTPVNAPEVTQSLPNPALFIEDAVMTGYIQSQLLLKKNIPSVKVTTENAVVSLKGTVDTQEQADTLVKVASSVKGVKRVNTDLLVVREKA
jgi:hypothetical protein